MKVKIEEVKNGWIVHYYVYEHMGEGFADRKCGEEKKAFTYDFKNEEENAWRRLEWFIADKFLSMTLHERVYLQIYDEEKRKWIGRQEFNKRFLKEEDYFDKNRWKDCKWVERGSGKVTRWTKENYKTFKKWEQERIARMTLGEWELRCANLTLDNLLKHFDITKPNHTCMTIEEYEEIRSASEKQCIEALGSKP